jgi:hypothetical protein
MRQIAQPPIDTPSVTASVTAVKTKVGKRFRGARGVPGAQALQLGAVGEWAMGAPDRR